MSDLRSRLARLGLSQYVDAFAAEGFDTWDTVLDITESDLSLLNVKLGHRRKLQRAILESRGQTTDRPLPAALARAHSTAESYRSGDESATEHKGKQGESNVTGAGTTGTGAKRKYRRHPRPDEHAPERPPSAYVIFSNQIRELLKGQELTFTEIAKIVGERWQVLPGDEREACERQANSAKEKYYAELADYKKTPQYDAYQKYLEDFRAKHAVPTKEGKRSKLEPEPTVSIRSSNHDQHERAVNRRLGSVPPGVPATGHANSGNSPPVGPARLPAGPSYSPKPTSPASYPLSGLSSPRAADQYSPMSASPRSNVFDVTTIRDPRTIADANYSYDGPAMHPFANGGIPAQQHVPPFQTPMELPPRRPTREQARLPPLTREDTTLSSESGHSASSYHASSLGSVGTLLPMDSVKSFRTLPQPIPSIGPPPTSLDRPPHVALSSHLAPMQPDYRTQGPLAALIRAGEIASRMANDEEKDTRELP